MSRFTYERENTNHTLETYEWDNAWWEHAPDHTTPRILAIGDSISCGWRHILNGVLQGEMYVDSFGTSKAVDHPYFYDAIRLFAAQQGHREIILFNNGLHGFHLSTAEYQTGYEQMVQNLLKTFPQSRLYLLLSTPTRRTDDLTRFDDRNRLVLERNAAVWEVAEKYQLPVIDLYAPLKDAPQHFSKDGVHLNENGYQILADIIADTLR